MTIVEFRVKFRSFKFCYWFVTVANTILTYYIYTFTYTAISVKRLEFSIYFTSSCYFSSYFLVPLAIRTTNSDVS